MLSFTYRHQQLVGLAHGSQAPHKGDDGDKHAPYNHGHGHFDQVTFSDSVKVGHLRQDQGACDDDSDPTQLEQSIMCHQRKYSLKKWTTISLMIRRNPSHLTRITSILIVDFFKFLRFNFFLEIRVSYRKKLFYMKCGVPGGLATGCFSKKCQNLENQKS